MAIYRGAGGAGDATADAASEALLISASVTAAQTSATNAATSATSASGSASTATTQASNASTSATNASNSASSASTYATNASNSASTATTQASAASTSATNAASSASAASTSASSASTYASNAASSASSASTSASNAATAQTAAEAARDATLAAYDNFDDRYLGSKTSDPTLDNDGNALAAGSLYFNSVSGAMKVYTGSAWVAAYVSGAGYLASANNLSDLASASTARTNLGVTATGADTTYAYRANNLSDLANAATARTNLGLGTAATTASTAYATAAQGTTADSAYADRLKWDGGATGLVAATGRTSLGLVASATTDTTNAANISSGTLPAARLPAFTGDATSTVNTSALTLATVNTNTGSFGSTTAIPVITVNGKGLITAVSTATVSGSISVTGGDLTLSGNTGTAITNATLATVNSNTGSFGSTTSIPVITVNGKGLITAVSTATVSSLPSQTGNSGKYLTTDGTTASWGTVSAGAALSNDTSTASNLYPLFAAATTGTPTTIYTSNAKYLYKPSTGDLSASQVIASNGLVVNSATVSSSYTIATGNNAMSVGPMTVASGQSVTVASGQRWVVL